MVPIGILRTIWVRVESFSPFSSFFAVIAPCPAHLAETAKTSVRFSVCFWETMSLWSVDESSSECGRSCSVMYPKGSVSIRNRHVEMFRHDEASCAITQLTGLECRLIINYSDSTFWAHSRSRGTPQGSCWTLQPHQLQLFLDRAFCLDRLGSSSVQDPLLRNCAD